EKRGEVQGTRLRVDLARRLPQQLRASDDLVHGTNAELRHQLAHLFGNEEEVAHDVLGLARELRAQCRILRGDADRARIQMAFAHHHAPFDDQRRRGKAELLGAQQRGYYDVAPRLELAVRLETHASAQTI